MSKPLLVFDMDGVLVDVTESYREAIAQTAAHFTGARISNERIQDYKNQGGSNDDWELTHRIVRDAGVEVPFETVKEQFQKLFLRSGDESLILRERWVARPGTLEKLAECFRFALFTGRPREEADLTLQRFAGAFTFDPIITMEDVANHKPHPEGLLKISGAGLLACPDNGPQGPPQCFYVGDSIDDARCARDAKVPFIGIAAPSNPRYIDLVFLFQEAGAYAIVDDINYLAEVFES